MPRSKDLDAHKRKVLDEMAAESPSGQEAIGDKVVETARATAEREKTLPKQPGHLDTRRPRLPDVDEQD